MLNRIINYIRYLFTLKKEEKYIIDFDKATLELRKADKYYISFRILNRWGYYFQGLNCLLFSLETFLKLLYILDKDDYTNFELIKLGHNLKKAFIKIRLDKQKFDIIFKIISNYEYTEIRYDSPDLVNELNQIDKNKRYVYLEKLHTEIEELHEIITGKIRKKFNAPNYGNGLNIYKYNTLDQDDKKNLIDDCLSKGDPNFSLDRC
jgi:hypothetical protein